MSGAVLAADYANLANLAGESGDAVNIERNSHYQIAIHHRDMIAMLKRWKPQEFVFNMIPEDYKGVTYEAGPQGVVITFMRKSQGPAELDFNRQQRETDGD